MDVPEPEPVAEDLEPEGQEEAGVTWGGQSTKARTTYPLVLVWS